MVLKKKAKLDPRKNPITRHLFLAPRELGVELVFCKELIPGLRERVKSKVHRYLSPFKPPQKPRQALDTDKAIKARDIIMNNEDLQNGRYIFTSVSVDV